MGRTWLISMLALGACASHRSAPGDDADAEAQPPSGPTLPPTGTTPAAAAVGAPTSQPGPDARTAVAASDGAAAGGDASGSAADAATFIPPPPAGERPRVPNLALWLDAAIGVTADANGRVTRWADQTGSGADATAASAATAPTLVANGPAGRPAIQTDRKTGRRLQITDVPAMNWGTADFALVLVLANQTPTGTRHLQGMTDFFRKGDMAHEIVFAGNWPGTETGPDTTELNARVGGEGSAGSVHPTDTGFNDGKLRVYTFRRVGTRLELRVDGKALGARDPKRTYDIDSTGSPASLGGSTSSAFCMTGTISEVVATRGPVPDANLQALEQYLLKKYALTP